MTDSSTAVLHSVSHHYGKRAALNDVTLTIPGGCMAGLIGPDGVGKSTLLGLVAGVKRLQSGQVLALGQDLASAQVRRAVSPRIAYMPQGLGRNLYATLSVRENLDFFGRMFGQSAAEREKRITDLLHATGLAPFPDRPAGKLSGGMKQKLALCCALIHDPDLLILDEPTTGVDPLSRIQFWELIATIRRRSPGMSVIVATAYMEEAEKFDWLAAMHDGRVLAQGAPDKLLQMADAKDLDQAFIRLLPEAERSDYREVIVTPRKPENNVIPAIRAHGLTRRFGDFTAVDNVSFEIQKGEIFGFLGSNGCGKTTTMKMLTGLLEPSSGSSQLFGKPIRAGGIAERRRVGYMSQSFSLYTELTVRQNLMLHAQLFGVPKDEIAPRVREVLAQFDLKDEADTRPDGMPLGIRQRLQLAVAVIHQPEILILDEPTSGVDPVARDAFWQALLDLSRNDEVTIFISTHFMNEAARCDRVSLMHAGRVLAEGAPSQLIADRGHSTLEETFVAYLQEAAEEERASSPGMPVEPSNAQNGQRKGPLGHGPQRIWACARREAIELIRDPIRLFFAIAGPIILLLTVGYGISFDVEGIKFAVLDQDETPTSRLLTEQFSSTQYFSERPKITSAAELDERFVSGELTVAFEVPPGFERDLMASRTPELSVWISGSMPFRAETARSYVQGVLQQFEAVYAKERGLDSSSAFQFQTRFLFNQAFRSVNAFIPTIMMLILMLIPAINSTIGVVREKETGPIANFRATPVTSLEFLLGKQIPYIGVALLNAAILFLLGLLLFEVPFKGEISVFLAGTLVYVMVSTAFGLVFSCFTKTQVSAVFATAIFGLIPAVNFSGLLVPLSSLSPLAQSIGLAFPPAWYQPVVMGAFTKGLGWEELWFYVAGLVGFYLFYMAVSSISLRKQER